MKYLQELPAALQEYLNTPEKDADCRSDVFRLQGRYT